MKAKDFSDQVLAFFHELTDTVRVLPCGSIVVTLPSSLPCGEEEQRALNHLARIFGRMETLYTPVAGDEVYEVIRRRLFEDAPDAAEVRRAADTVWEMYQRLGDMGSE